MSREGENRPPIGGVLNYKNMVEIIHAISHKLSRQYPTNWWSKVCNTIWNGYDLQYNLERL